MTQEKGTVYLIGAGPGEPDLITVKGKEILQNCDVILYDNLIADELVISLPETIQKIYVGKEAGRHYVPQDKLNELMAQLAGEGKNIARLKGGDPFIFGRGGEELEFLKNRSIKCEVVPGITSGIAAPMYAGIPCTDRRKSSFVLFVTGHKSKHQEVNVPWEWIGKAQGGTIVIYMGVAEVAAIVSRLIAAGMAPHTPTAIVERGTYTTQKTVVCELKDLALKVENECIASPALFVIGEAVTLKPTMEWFQDRPLRGMRIAVTRPADQAHGLYRSLRQLGAEVQPCPTIATREYLCPQLWEQWTVVQGNKRWLIFTSENGVRYFFKQFNQHIGDIRQLATFKIAAVGEDTADALTNFNLHADFVPSNADLAKEMREKLDLSQAIIFRIQGNMSDDTIEKILHDTGASIFCFTVYHTFYPTWPAHLKTRLLECPPHILMFTSDSSVDGLFTILSPEEIDVVTRKAIIASIGPSTSKTIVSRGLTVTIEANVHSIPGLVEAISKYESRPYVQKDVADSHKLCESG